jgi:DNA topoisomerase-1
LLAATSATSRGRRSKSTSKQKQISLVVKGPPGFLCPPMEDDRPFKLVIVESPSKCQTISKILQEYVNENNLGYDFVLTSSMGHIRDLPKKKTDKGQKIAGIDLNNDYRPTYVVLEGKEGLLSELEELSGYAQQLVLATDDDREGEAMAWHLLQLLYSSNNKHQEPPIRVRFTEITRKAIVNAIEHSEPNLRDNLVQAQETRRILDRLAGFTLSPVLARKIVSHKEFEGGNPL